MTLIRTQEFTLENHDRLQLKSESNFSIDVLKELLEVRPVEICIVKTFTSSLILRVNHVPGISISLIKAELENAPYVADIDSQHYQRLVLGIDADSHSWVVNCSSLTSENLESLSTKPIVVKAMLEPGRGQALLFAADSKFRFLKATDSRTDKIAFEPDNVPDSLLRLVDIVDEPLPTKRVSLEILEERAKTTHKLLSNYGEKKLTIKGREELQHALAEIYDFQLKIQSAISECMDGDIYTDLFHQKLLAKLKQVMGSKKFEQQIGLFHREIKRELLKGSGKEEKHSQIDLSEFVLRSVGEDEEFLKSQISKLLNRNLSANMHIHQCSNCKSSAVCNYVPGMKKFQVSCEHCANKSENEDISARRIFSIIKWNLNNTDVDVDFWKAFLGFGDISHEEFKTHLNRISTIFMVSINQIRKSFGSQMNDKVEFKEIQDLVEILKFASKIASLSK